jgi:hypothetical protein
MISAALLATGDRGGEAGQVIALARDIEVQCNKLELQRKSNAPERNIGHQAE